ncbi:MAG: hypothetical protein ACYTDY_05510 [Planctomycetota bacterium]|jgi:hypothetical protein
MRYVALAVVLLLAGGAILADERERRLQKDREVAEENGWIYNSLAKGIAEAEKTGKPLLVVIRCPP